MPLSTLAKRRSNVGTLLTCAAGLITLTALTAPAAIGAAGDTDDVPTVGAGALDPVGKVRRHKLKSIALSPATFGGPPGATDQVQVEGTYPGGFVRPLKDAETYSSSDPSVATVSASGLVTIVAGAPVGASAIIGATNVATGISTGTGEDTAITVTTPSPNSVAAATATATDNPLCIAIVPFYWEIGDQNALIASDSIGTTSTGPIEETTQLQIASASKLLYASYVVQERGAASALSSSDIDFLHFTSGYTNMNDNSTTSVCPPTLSPDTVDSCLKLKNPSGASYDAQNPLTIGVFDYNSGHMENHASQNMGLGNVGVKSLGATISAELGAGVSFTYTEPLLAGGVTTTASMYALVLRNILNGSLFMHDALGTSPVCTLASSTCNAFPGGSFVPEAWHYSIGHWVEDDPTTNGDGAFSSPGANGFYPWIDQSKSYYGIISRDAPSAAYTSAECGRLIRRAFITGVEQTGTIPTN